MSLKDILQTIEEDPKLKSAMDTLQLNEKSFRLLPLFPLVFIAWSDGKLQQEEITKILEVADENGLSEGDGTGLLSVWLNPEQRPSDEFFTSGLRLVAGVLQYTDLGYKGNLLMLCEDVAEVAGWAGRKTLSEKKAIGQVAELLGIDGEKGLEVLLTKMERELEPEELIWLSSRVSFRWVVINGIVSVCSASTILFGLWWLYPTFVVTSAHMTIFTLLGLFLPQIGFFVGSLITARLSPGDTSQEGVMGTAFAIALAMMIGFGFLSSASKKFAGYQVLQPEFTTFPQCTGLKASGQSCVLVTKHRDSFVCRILKSGAGEPSKELGTIYKDWYPYGACEEKPADPGLFLAGTKQPRKYAVSVRPERLHSKGYYPLCEETTDRSAACIRVFKKPGTQNLVCRVMKDAKRPVKGQKLGQKFSEWFPAPHYCHAVYTRVYALWQKKGVQKSFVGFLPNCSDLSPSQQECIHQTSIVRKDTTKSEKVCLVANHTRLEPHQITPERTPYKNWYPRSECRELSSTTPILVMFSVLGFAVFAFFASWLGGIAGERWQGTI
ncbi:MAG: hypothetical protein CL920_14925 [Deltaproteobacteria bacterium]|nr:hypothetical protein [Deltaproteobacteria bacterium]